MKEKGFSIEKAIPYVSLGLTILIGAKVFFFNGNGNGNGQQKKGRNGGGYGGYPPMPNDYYGMSEFPMNMNMNMAPPGAVPYMGQQTPQFPTNSNSNSNSPAAPTPEELTSNTVRRPVLSPPPSQLQQEPSPYQEVPDYGYEGQYSAPRGRTPHYA